MAPRARPRPGGAERRGGGTWATELHGGSDIGATTTVARKEGDHFRLNGLKWFTSNPIGGIAVATARPEGALAAVVRSAYDDCREAIGYVQGDSMEARRHARKLLGFMADTLAVGLLLEEVREAHAAGDGRKALVARLFIECHFEPPARRGIQPGQDWAQRHFAALVGYDPVEPAAARLPV